MHQYHQPADGFNVGDCMPFWHDGTFHLYYLLDQEHHQAKGGLGGHQWAHVSTRDLIHWEEHPLSVATGPDPETSICTGSAFYHDGKFHAFYAVRWPDWSQHFGCAVSSDAVTFRKVPPPASVAPPPECHVNDFRDPFVFAGPDGRFHLLMTSRIEQPLLHDCGGCLLRYSSVDLATWQPEGIFFAPGLATGYNGVPECPDLFEWNGWYYLLFGQGLKTFYRMSRQPFGPWQRPRVDALDGGRCAVMKTAPFGEERRIGVGWVGPSREGDGSPMHWGGRAVFRELVQRADGTLGTKFPPEMVPTAKERLTPKWQALTPGVTVEGDSVRLDAAMGLEVAYYDPPARDVRVRCRVTCGEGTTAFGLGLRGSGQYEQRYDLRLDLSQCTMTLAGETLPLYDAPTTATWSLDVVVQNDVIDVCVNDRQCLIHRLHELTGQRLFLFCEDGSANFEDIQIDALASVTASSA